MEPKEAISLHEKLKLDEADVNALDASGTWQKMRRLSEEDANRALFEVGFGRMPEEPMAMLAWFLDLRAQIRTGFELGRLFDTIKETTQSRRRELEGGHRPRVESEDVDLDAGQEAVY